MTIRECVRSTALLIELGDTIAVLNGLEKSLRRTSKMVSQWLRVEVAAAGRADQFRISIKPTQRLEKLLAAALAAGGDQRSVERPAGSPRVAHNLSRGGHGRKVTPRSVRKQSPGGAA